MKVIGVSGSPRRGGNSELLLEQALDGAKSRGAGIEKLVLDELEVNPCRNCDDCLESGVCTTQDDMQAIYPRLDEVDCLFLASPVFFLTVTAQTKAFIDRCQCLWVRRNVLKVPDKKRRRGLFISTAHSERPVVFQSAISVVRAFFSTLNVGYDAELLFGGMEEKGQIALHPTALKEAFEVGARLASGEEVAEPMAPMVLRPIGVVRNMGEESEVILQADFAEALDGIEGFSHIKVLYWMHKLSPQGRSTMKVHPRGRMKLPLTGVFATRSPSRPNPVGISTVRLLERRGNILRVQGLDAIDGTPVIDIKPYLPGYDSTPDASVPDWVGRRDAG